MNRFYGRKLAGAVAVVLLLALAVPAVGFATGNGVSAAGVRAVAMYAPDAYESADDTWTTAPVLPVTSIHTFDSNADDWNDTEDQDWFKVSVTASNTPIMIDGVVNGPSNAMPVLDVFYAANATASPSATSVAGFGPADVNDWDWVWPAPQKGEYAEGGFWISQMCKGYYVAPVAGTYYFRLTPSGAGWGYHADNPRDIVMGSEWGSGAFTLNVVVGDARRIYGPDRYMTAVNVAEQMWDGSDTENWNEGPWGEAVIVASGQNFPDALAAGAMSVQTGMPLLLTPTGALPEAVSDEITALGMSNFWKSIDPPDELYKSQQFGVYIVGGTGAVSTAVENALKANPSVNRITRLGGANRYATAVKIADETSKVTGGAWDMKGYGNTAFVVNGLNFADALAAGPVAGWGQYPILMASPTAVASETTAWMASNNTTNVIVCGGPSAIATSVLDQIQSSVPGTQVFTRLAGADRYETSYKIAKYGVAMYSMEGSSCQVASGESFADGLSAAQLAFMTYAPTLLTPKAALSPWVEQYYKDNDGFDRASYVVGGPAAVSDAACASLRDMWKKPF